MKLIISGCSQSGGVSIAKLEINENDQYEIKTLWSDNPMSPSFACTAGDRLVVGLEHSNGGEMLLYQALQDGYEIADKVEIVGGELCHLFYSEKYNLIYGSCYQDGSLATVRVEDGKLTLLDEMFEKGENGSRSHCCIQSPDGKYIYVVNIAQDRLYCYKQTESGIERNLDFPYFQLEKGEGPRHICFCEKTNRLFLITEYSNKFFVFGYDEKTGELKLIDSCSTLPQSFVGESYGSSIAISNNGERIYCANRGANTIAVFDISQSDSVVKVQDFDCRGNFPRHIALSKDNRYLLSANQRSNDVAVIRLNGDGEFGEIATVIPFETPSYIEDVT